STEPTDRSIPAVMITKVMPTDRISNTEVSISVVCALNRVGKAFGASALNTTHSATSTSPIQNTFAPISRCHQVGSITGAVPLPFSLVGSLVVERASAENGNGTAPVI